MEWKNREKVGTIDFQQVSRIAKQSLEITKDQLKVTAETFVVEVVWIWRLPSNIYFSSEWLVKLLSSNPGACYWLVVSSKIWPPILKQKELKFPFYHSSYVALATVIQSLESLLIDFKSSLLAKIRSCSLLFLRCAHIPASKSRNVCRILLHSENVLLHWYRSRAFVCACRITESPAIKRISTTV